MVKTGTERSKKYTAKFQPDVLALRAKRMRGRATANVQSPMFNYFLSDTSLQDFYDTLTLKYGQRGEARLVFYEMVTFYESMTEVEKEVYHQRWLQMGLTESAWLQLIALILEKLTEFSLLFYKCSVNISTLLTTVTPSVLDVSEEMSVGNSLLQTLVCAHNVTPVVAPLLNTPSVEFVVESINLALDDPNGINNNAYNSAPTLDISVVKTP